VPGKSDRDQLVALRRLRAAFGDIQVLAVHPSQVQGEPASPSPASQQLDLTMHTRQHPDAGAITPPSGRSARPTRHPSSEVAMSFRSDAHLLLGSEPTPPEVTAWQHPEFPDSFTVALDTEDRRGHIAITGSPRQLIELLTHMTKAISDTATAAGQHPDGQTPTQPATTAS
jgi:hypothetical protein